MITGGTQGIGRAHADILAKKWKFNLIIVSNDNPGLQKIKKDFAGTPTEVHTIKADLCSSDPKVAQKVWDEASQKDVGILMNNVGLLNFERFHEKSVAQIQKEANLTVFPNVYLTKLALDSFNQRKQKSLIVNTCSDMGLFPGHLTQYNANKRFMVNFTDSLASDNVDFNAFTPGCVSTKLCGDIQPQWPGVASAEAAAEEGIQNWGKSKIFAGTLGHQIMIEVLGSLPTTLLEPVQEKMMSDVLSSTFEFRNSSKYSK